MRSHSAFFRYTFATISIFQITFFSSGLCGEKFPKNRLKAWCKIGTVPLSYSKVSNYLLQHSLHIVDEQRVHMRGVHLYQTNLIPNQSFVKIVIFRSVQSSNIFLFLCIFRSFYHILAYFLKFIFSIYFFQNQGDRKMLFFFCQ